MSRNENNYHDRFAKSDNLLFFTIILECCEIADLNLKTIEKCNFAFRYNPQILLSAAFHKREDRPSERSERIGDSRNKACRPARREQVFARSGAKCRGESDLLAGRVIISLEPE